MAYDYSENSWKNHYSEIYEEQLDATKPWVGLSIIAASVFCTLAMAADAFNGFRLKKLWFPSKYFSLDAISVTLLAVALKLTMDINNEFRYIGIAGSFPKLSGLIFLSTALGNFLTSLGPMSDKEILANVVALGILIVKVVVSVCFQFFQFWFLGIELLVPSILVLFLLATLVSLASTVPTTKRSLEPKYQEKHQEALREEEVSNLGEAFRIDVMRGYMMKYWVMAETSSPQFVLARSVVSTTSALISLLAAIALPLAYFQLVDEPILSPSAYGGYTAWIVLIQFIGVVVGIVAPTLRWYVAVSFKCSTTNWNSFKKGFKIEKHWIQTLVDWRDSSTLLVRPDKYRKYLHDAKWFTLTFCIRVQISIVLVSKLLVFLSALLVREFIVQDSQNDTTSNDQTGIESAGGDALNLNCYVLLLEGEEALPRGVLKKICRQADNIFETGKKKQSKDLIVLLRKFDGFTGVGKFDSKQIKRLQSQEPQNCWTLPVMTLTSIAIALPGIAKDKVKELKVKELLRGMSEGFSLAKFVDKTLDKNAQLLNIRKAANVSWVEVVLYKKWLGMDLRKTSLRCENYRKVLEELSKKAKNIIEKFKGEVKDPVMEKPINWPAEIVAANSMYRISKTILLSFEGENELTDDGLFEQLSVMIAKILAACFTNLLHAITTICHHNAIEKREKSVRKAFLLLGKTEKVVEFLQHQEWPSDLHRDKAASIEEWRDLSQPDEVDPATSASTSTSSDDIVTAPVSTEGHLAVKVDC